MSNNDWLALAIMSIFAAGIMGPLFWSLHMAKKDISPDETGWITLRRSSFDHVMGVTQFGFAVSWIVLSSTVFLTGNMPQEFGAAAIIVAMFVMGFVFLKEFMFTYRAKIRFNHERLEYSAPWRRIGVFWNEVSKIKMGINGPTIVTVDGGFSVANTRRGFFQLIDYASANGVEIENSVYLRRSGAAKSGCQPK